MLLLMTLMYSRSQLFIGKKLTMIKWGVSNLQLVSGKARIQTQISRLQDQGSCPCNCLSTFTFKEWFAIKSIFHSYDVLLSEPSL